jgi:hypothetical protein
MCPYALGGNTPETQEQCGLLISEGSKSGKHGLALILSVRGTIPIWLGIGLSAMMLLFFSNNNIAYGVRSVLSSGGQAVLNMFR